MAWWLWLLVALALFSAVALVSLAWLRAPLERLMAVSGPQPPVVSPVGEIGTVLEDVGAGGVGRVEVRRVEPAGARRGRLAARAALRRGARRGADAEGEGRVSHLR